MYVCDSHVSDNVVRHLHMTDLTFIHYMRHHKRYRKFRELHIFSCYYLNMKRSNKRSHAAKWEFTISRWNVISNDQSSIFDTFLEFDVLISFSFFFRTQFTEITNIKQRPKKGELKKKETHRLNVNTRPEALKKSLMKWMRENESLTRQLNVNSF